MKNIFKILFLLFFAIIFCGCNANSVAIYKLNSAAREFMDDNDYKNALSRLESSYELDYKNYQTRYMLTCAYLREHRCKEALEHALFITDIKPQEPAVHLLRGDSYDCVAKDIYETSLINSKTQAIDIKDQRDLKKYLYDLNKANEAYDKYYDLMPNVEDSDKILNKINENKVSIAKMEVYLRK